MTKLTSNFLVALVLASAVIASKTAKAQATDVDCIKCVDTADIANFAVGSGKIDNGAVTTNKIADQAVTGAKIENGSIGVSKVGPKLKNAIGTFCPPGQAVIGMKANGHFVCELFSPLGDDIWVMSDFDIGGTNVVNDCSLGEKWVKRSNFDAQLFVGATLCSNERYKLFLSDSATGTYWEIADQAGHGQDHCELIGGTVTTATSTFTGSPPLPSGFFRSQSGEEFQFGTPPPGNAFRVSWYECGLSIP